MKIFYLTILSFLSFAFVSFAQNTAENIGITSAIVARTGIQTDGSNATTYHLVEFFQCRGEWIYPDIGYVDYAKNDYHELFVGGGRVLYGDEIITVTEEFYFVQAVGSAAQNARYLWLFTLVDVNIAPKLTGEAVYFPYIPLNRLVAQ